MERVFTVLQIPFVDARPFLQEDTYRLSSPAWPIARPYVDFVRSFGIVKRRLRGGIDDWHGEDCYCNAGRAVRLSHSFSTIDVSAGSPAKLECVFRRLLKGSESVARVEFGFRCGANQNGISRPQAQLENSDCLKLLHSVLKLRVRIPSLDGKEFHDLGEGGNLIAKLYLRSTTRRLAGKPPPVNDWWITQGEPLMVAELGANELKATPRFARPVEADVLSKNGITLTYLRLTMHGREFGCWLLRNEAKPDSHSATAQVLRQLRLNLFRLHAELEATKQVFRWVYQNKIVVTRGTPASEALQRFLQDSIRLLSRQTRNGLPQSDILEVVQGARELVTSGERAVILDQLVEIRRNLLKNVEVFLEPKPKRDEAVYNITNPSHITIYHVQGDQTMNKQELNITNSTVGDVNQVAAETIKNSINKTKESNAPENMKGKLEELGKVVEEMCKRLPEGQQKKVARDLDTLANEATSESPRKEWYELSAKGLMDAAKAVGEVASPVISTTKAILAML